MKKNRKYILGIMIIIIQYLIICYLSNELKLGEYSKKVQFFLYVFLYLKEDIYSFKSYLIWDEIKKQLKSYIEYLVIITIFMRSVNLWKYYLIATITLVFSLILTKVIRLIFRKIMKKNVVIVGVGDSAKELEQIILNNRFTMYNFLGFIDVNKNREVIVKRNEIVANIITMKEYIKTNEVDEVIIALPNISNKDLNKVVDQFEGLVKYIKIVPKLHRMYTFAPEIQDYDGVMLISAKNNMISIKRRIIKRVFDIFGALVGMIIFFILYLKYGYKIKKDGGTVLFAHERVGKNLKKFKMYKFRTMYKDSEEKLERLLEEDEKLRDEFYKNFKLKNDPRVTPLGEHLRKTSLDEIPQFINVLKGEMSLVGPRPVVEKEVKMYYGTEMGKKIFQVKPGITGMWQSHGRSDIEDYEERIDLDLYYIRNWSLWLDIIILIKTMKNVIGKKGAY